MNPSTFLFTWKNLLVNYLTRATGGATTPVAINTSYSTCCIHSFVCFHLVFPLHSPIMPCLPKHHLALFFGEPMCTCSFRLGLLLHPLDCSPHYTHSHKSIYIYIKNVKRVKDMVGCVFMLQKEMMGIILFYFLIKEIVSEWDPKSYTEPPLPRHWPNHSFVSLEFYAPFCSFAV